MIKNLLLIFLFISSVGFAQHTIKGTLKTKEKYPWMLAYQLNGSKQDFITYDSIKQGIFELNLSPERKSGVYRLVYDVQNRLSLDVFYDKEDIEFSFNPSDPSNSIVFYRSKNNIIYQDYIQTILPIETTLDSIQIAYFDTSEPKKLEKLYASKRVQLNEEQLMHEKKAMGLFVYDFIKNNKKYYANTLLKNPNDYLNELNTHFYDHIDFTNKTVSNSTFYHDKINTYIFRLNTADDKEVLKALRKKAIDNTLLKLKNNSLLSQDIQEGLLYNFAQIQDVEMTNHVLNHYLKLPKENQDISFINDIKGQLRTAVGNIAPNILWEEKGSQKTLHLLSGTPYYLVVFWSSTCGHCLKELPLLANFLKSRNNIKVVAIGLETEDSKNGWKAETYKYKNWLHVYGKDKWKNKYAKAYGVNSTPSFYLLDTQKKIVAKPDDVKELEIFFNSKK